MSMCRSVNRLPLSTPEGHKYILYFRDISLWLLLNALYTGLSQQIYVMSQLTWYNLIYMSLMSCEFELVSTTALKQQENHIVLKCQERKRRKDERPK